MQDSLNHLALIMDGNGRWAKQKNHDRVFGHIKGMKASLEIIEYCSKIKIPYLSLFTLSTENLHRSQTEVDNLKKLLKKAFKKYSGFLMQNQIRFHILGDLSVFSKDIQQECLDMEKKTLKNKGLNLIIALNYGGRWEILQAFRNCLKSHKPDEALSEEGLHKFFPSSRFPAPDLIVRTGGHLRISNFYLWSIAYSELYFTKTLWPEFKLQDLKQALKDFHNRKRLYGR